MADDILKQVAEIVNKIPERDEYLILSKDDVDRIIVSLATSRGEKGFTEEEAFLAIKWCEDARIRESLVSLVLDGMADINWTGDDDGPSFISTDKGRKIIGDLRGTD